MAESVVKSKDSDSDESDSEVDDDKGSNLSNFESDTEEEIEMKELEDGEFSDSSEDKGPVCSICLNSFIGQELGSPENCAHTFCLECIVEWSKNTNNCPIDRIEFDNILMKLSVDGDVLKKVKVKRYPKDDNDNFPEEITLCEVCERGDREDRLLLCDSCDLAYHCECLTPPLQNVPIEEWFCPPCAAILNKKPRASQSQRRPRRIIARTIVSETVRSRIQMQRTILSEGHSSCTSQPIRSTASRSRTTLHSRGTKRVVKRRRRRRRTTKKLPTLARTVAASGRGKTCAKTNVTSTRAKSVKRRRRKRKCRRKVVKKTTRSWLSSKRLAAPSTKRRIADHLGLCKPPPGHTMPYVKKTALGSQQHPAFDGSSAHSLFGIRDQLMDFEEDFTGSQSVAVDQSPNSSRQLKKEPEEASISTIDILGSIMSGQEILQKRCKEITIGHDGSLKLNVPSERTVKKENQKLSKALGKEKVASAHFVKKENSSARDNMTVIQSKENIKSVKVESKNFITTREVKSRKKMNGEPEHQTEEPHTNIIASKKTVADGFEECALSEGSNVFLDVHHQKLCKGEVDLFPTTSHVGCKDDDFIAKSKLLHSKVRRILSPHADAVKVKNNELTHHALRRSWERQYSSGHENVNDQSISKVKTEKVEDSDDDDVHIIIEKLKPTQRKMKDSYQEFDSFIPHDMPPTMKCHTNERLENKPIKMESQCTNKFSGLCNNDNLCNITKHYSINISAKSSKHSSSSNCSIQHPIMSNYASGNTQGTSNSISNSMVSENWLNSNVVKHTPSEMDDKPYHQITIKTVVLNDQEPTSRNEHLDNLGGDSCVNGIVSAVNLHNIKIEPVTELEHFPVISNIKKEKPDAIEPFNKACMESESPLTCDAISAVNLRNIKKEPLSELEHFPVIFNIKKEKLDAVEPFNKACTENESTLTCDAAVSAVNLHNIKKEPLSELEHFPVIFNIKKEKLDAVEPFNKACTENESPLSCDAAVSAVNLHNIKKEPLTALEHFPVISNIKKEKPDAIEPFSKVCMKSKISVMSEGKAHTDLHIRHDSMLLPLEINAKCKEVFGTCTNLANVVKTEQCENNFSHYMPSLQKVKSDSECVEGKKNLCFSTAHKIKGKPNISYLNEMEESSNTGIGKLSNTKTAIEVACMKRKASLSLDGIGQSKRSKNSPDMEKQSASLKDCEGKAVVMRKDVELHIENVIKEILKPFYLKKAITKDNYKDIMRKCVPKVLKHSANGIINRKKIRYLVLSYVHHFCKK